MRRAASAIVVVAAALAALDACHFFTGVSPCLDGQACPDGLVCDAKVGICAEPVAPPAEGSCDAPLPLAIGDSVQADTRDGAPSALNAATCAFAGGDATEVVYRLVSDHDARVRVAAVPDASTRIDIQLYARDAAGCADPFSELVCVDGFEAGGGEDLLIDLVKDAPVFIVVDGFRQVDEGIVAVTVSEVAPLGGACDLDGLRLCDQGLDCTDNVCVHKPGDLCDGALPLEGAGGTVTGDTTGYLSDENVQPICTTSPANPQGFDTDGPDLFYVVTLQPGETFNATLTPPLESDLGLYFQETCPPPEDGSCLGFIDAFNAGGLETGSFTNDRAEPLTLYAIIDAFAPTESGEYTLDWSITGP
jgi:hypothetical protein